MPTRIAIQPHETHITITNADGSQATTTLNLAITPIAVNNTLHQYNLPGATSLHPATGLRTLFPGLKLQTTVELDTQHPAELVKLHRPQSEPGDELYIHSPGEEHHILHALAEAGLLSTFSHLILLAHEVPMYQNAQPAQTTLAWLQEQGFEHKTTNTEDPDWPTYQLIRNPLQNTIDVLNKDLSEAKKALDNSQARAKQQVAKQEILKEQFSAQHEQNKKLAVQNQTLQNQLQQNQNTIEELKTSLVKAKEIHQAEEQEKQKEKLARQDLEAELKQVKEQHEEQLEKINKALRKEQITHQETIKALEDHKQKHHLCTQQVEQLHTERHELNLQAEQLKNENQNLKESWDKLKVQHTKLQTDNQAQKNELETSRIDVNNQRQHISELKKQLEQTNSQLENVRQQLEQATKECQQLQEQLGNQSNAHNALKILQERMEYLFGQNTLQLEQAANALGQHISHTAQYTARELEAGLTLKQQLGPDIPALGQSEGGLPTSAALQLARQLKNHPYDLIIEMGNSVITSFMAHTLKNAHNNGQQQNTDQKKLARYLEASEYDLPKRILSFEHNRSRHNELSTQLNNNGLANYVSLQFTPLVPFQYHGKEHLFYDCAKRLQQLAQLFDSRQARILVVVNQSGDDCQPEIVAALPLLLQYLSAHTLDMIVNTPGNTELIGQWKSLLAQRGLEYRAATDFGVVHIQRLTVNP